MFALLTSIRENTIETPDTGTFADGAFTIPLVDLRAVSRQDVRSGAYARDYGAGRKVQPDLIGYA